MKEIDVFVDLEPLGVGSASDGRGRNLPEVLDALAEKLAEDDFSVRSLWGTASARNRNHLITGEQQIAVRQVFIQRNGDVAWTNGIADHALIAEVLYRKRVGTLSQTVLLVACDHDFCSLVKNLRQSNVTVFVAGHDISTRLKSVAQRVILLKDLLVSPEPVVLPAPPMMFNSISIQLP